MAKRRVAVMAFLLCLCLSWLPRGAWAASTADAREPISPDKGCSLTIAYRYDGTNFSNHPVKLYKIADVSADLQYCLTAPFANSKLLLNGVQSVGEWNVIRATLEAHILAYDIAADLTAVTDEEGQVCFRDLKPGLYLAVTEKVSRDGWVYSFDSALIALPGLDADGLWQYNVAVVSKSAATALPETDAEMEFKVLKLWKGDQGRSDRPESVEVEIFRNGASYQTVVLSEENHWAYCWKAKDDGADWTVVERNIPSGYTLTIEKREASFVLTNTRPTDPPDLPKTGDTANVMLWVVLMILSGSMLMVFGITGKRKRV